MLGERLRFAPNVGPFYGHFANGTRHPRILQQIERFKQHTSLKRDMKRDAKVMSHGPGQENCPWRLDLFGYIARDCDRDSRNASGFNRALDQSDGLMADRSSGGQQGGVGSFVFGNGFGDIIGHSTFEFLRVHVVADEAKETLA